MAYIRKVKTKSGATAVQIVVQPGYDGEFGVVKIWSSPNAENQVQLKSEQPSLF